MQDSCVTTAMAHRAGAALLAVLASSGLAQRQPPAPPAWPFAWRAGACVADPSGSRSCATDAGVAFELSRRTCTLPAGMALGPGTAMQPDLLAIGGAAVDVTLFASPSWNQWSAAGAPIIYGAAGDTTFPYVQLLNSSGAYVACEFLHWLCLHGAAPASAPVSQHTLHAAALPLAAGNRDVVLAACCAAR